MFNNHEQWSNFKLTRYVLQDTEQNGFAAVPIVCFFPKIVHFQVSFSTKKSVVCNRTPGLRQSSLPNSSSWKREQVGSPPRQSKQNSRSFLGTRWLRAKKQNDRRRSKKGPVGNSIHTNRTLTSEERNKKVLLQPTDPSDLTSRKFWEEGQDSLN